MVGAMRGTPEGFRLDQASSPQQPPPAPPNLAEVMAQQTELLNQLVQAQMNQFHHQHRGRDEPPSVGYQDFFSTQSPLFHKTEEPLDADAWFRTIESKLRYYPHHVQKQIRHFSQHSSFTALPAFGGIIIMPCSLKDM
jgi:hypothetical protein